MIKKLLRRIFGRTHIDNRVQSLKISGNKRILDLDDGDSCLILKKDGRSIIIDSGEKQLSKADEIICMVWCYLANPEFVKILEALFSEIVDEINADKLRDNLTVGRSGVYAKDEDKPNEK